MLRPAPALATSISSRKPETRCVWSYAAAEGWAGGANAVLGKKRAFADDRRRPELALALGRLDDDGALEDDVQPGSILAALDQHAAGGDRRLGSGRLELAKIVVVHCASIAPTPRAEAYGLATLPPWPSRSSTARSEAGTTNGRRVSRPS